jgi:hypothetical protein
VSLSGRFDNPEITAVARSLDVKLASSVNKVKHQVTRWRTVLPAS